MKAVILKFLFLIILLLSLFLNGNTKDFPYEGLSINVSDNGYKSISNLYNGIYRSMYLSSKISLIKKNDILESLKDNFTNMVNFYNTNKSDLPKCVGDAFDSFFNDLKTPNQDGKPKAIIEWNIYNDKLGRSGYRQSEYNKDYDDFYFQDESTSTKTINGWIFNIKSNCSGNVYDESQVEENSWESNISIVNIYAAFRDKCQAHCDYSDVVNGKEVIKTYNTMVSTPSLIFHELIHLIFKRYPDLFNSFKTQPEWEWMEEVIVEILTETVFGDELTPEFYRDYKYKNEIEQFLKENNLEKIDLNVICNLICTDKSQCEKSIEKFNWLNDEFQSPFANRAKGMFMDTPDDHYSYFEGIYQMYNLAPGCVILERGTWGNAVQLLGGLTYNGDNSAEQLLEVSPILFLPSGSLTGKESDSVFKAILQKYVFLGGTVIILSQQYGNHIDNLGLIPEGESLKSYGFREDQSCLKNSVYFSASTMHPVLSSCSTELLDAGVDGYFSVYPSEATVLLRRKINEEPALLYYPYGQGKVILTSLFTDFAASHSMASSAELKVVRDLMTFAKAKNPIPMFNLEENPNPSINLTVRVINSSETPVVKARLKAQTPDRTEVYYESDVALSLNPGESADVPINFTLRDLLPAHFGISHVDYELYDGEDNLAQMSTESETGMFSIYKTPTPTVINNNLYEWITVKSEIVYWGQEVECTMHFKNTSDEVKTISANNPFFKIDHGDPIIPCSPFNITINPGQTYEQTVSFPTTYFSETSNSKYTFRIQYYDEGGVLKQIGAAKVVFLKSAITNSTVSIEGTNALYPGQPVNYIIQSDSTSNLSGESTIKLVLEKRNSEIPGYTELKTIYEGIHDFTTGNFAQSATYIPETVHPYGSYRLRLDVTSPNGVKELSRTAALSYLPSGFQASLGRLTQNGVTKYTLIPGASYSIPVHLSNTLFPDSNYTVQKGICIVRLVSKKSNTEIFRKELPDITIAFGEQQELLESFVFNPVETGRYTLEYAYKDESRETLSHFAEAYSYWYSTSVNIISDKTAYNLLDIANLNVNIKGMGTYTVTFTCPSAGLTETRNIVIPEDSLGISELFQVQIPIGLNSLYQVNVQVTDATQMTITKQIDLYVQPVLVEINEFFSRPYASAGNPLEFTLNLKGYSGITHPLSSELTVTAPGFDFQETRPVILQPLEENIEAYSIPIPVEIQPGYFPITVQLKMNGIELKTEVYSVHIPGPDLKLSTVSSSYTAGENIEITIENSGGQPGEFSINLGLVDDRLVEIVSLQDTLSVKPGETKSLVMTIPSSAKSGSYTLSQSAEETQTNKTFVDYRHLQITGLTTQVNAYTLKESYFSTESITAKAEITTEGAAAAVENATLSTRVVRFIQAQGITEQQPGEFISYNLAETGYSHGNMLYLVTDKGVISNNTETGAVQLLYDFSENQGFNSSDLLVTAAGYLWIATSDGIYSQNQIATPTDEWTHVTTATGLAGDWVYDLLEVNNAGGSSEMWAATDGGVSVNRDNQWTTYTTADGLPSTYVYALASDGSGTVWASTSKGVATFNGTGFVSAGAPFGTTSVSNRLVSTADGSIWAATTTQLYRRTPATATWDQWSLTTLAAEASLTTLSIHDMETVNGKLQIKARGRDASYNYYTVIITYDTGFSYFSESEIPGLAGLNYEAIIPGNSGTNDSVYYICEVGLMRQESGTWTHRVINVDSHKLCGPIHCLSIDAQGRLWAGTSYGIALYSNSTTKEWTNLYSTTGNQLITEVTQLEVDTQNRVTGYSASMGGILRYTTDGTGNETLELISFPYDLGYWPMSGDRLATDSEDRVWLGGSKLYYYDQTGTWQQYTPIRYITCMINDRDGGVWVGSWNDYSQYHLQHVDRNLAVTDYTSDTSGLLAGEIDKLYLDPTGKLWLKQKESNWGDMREMQSFDGENWHTYSSIEGYPPMGAQDFVMDDQGKMHIVDPNGALYVLKENRFQMEMEQTGYSHHLIWWQGNLHCVGTLDNGGGEVVAATATAMAPLLLSSTPSTSTDNLITLSTAAETGLGEQDMWSTTDSVTLSPGTETAVDMNIGQPNQLSAGTYLLKSVLYSPTGQELGQSSYSFRVRQTGYSVSIAPAGTTPVNDNRVRNTSEMDLLVESLNGGETTGEELSLLVTQISPSGNETELLSRVISLAPGQVETQSLTVTPGETGIWTLRSQLLEGGVIVSGQEMVVEAVEPRATLKITAPEAAGDETYTVTIYLRNTGQIPVSLTLEALESENSLLHNTLTLAPGHQQVEIISGTITAPAYADKTYTIQLSGDVEVTKTHTVTYGNKESFSMTVPPAVREGIVTIPYTIINTGSQAFTEHIQAVLYSVGNPIPITTQEQTVNLYPGQPAITGAIETVLSPGSYEIRYGTTRQAEATAVFTVQPSGIGTIAVTPSATTGGTTKLYSPGAVEVGITITNSDTYTGQIPIQITLNRNENGTSTPVLTETRLYTLTAAETQADTFNYELAETGDYTLNLIGDKLSAPVQIPIQVVNLEEVTATLELTEPTEPEMGTIQLHITLENKGLTEFSGTAVIEVDGIIHEEPVIVEPVKTYTGTIAMDTAVLTPGTKTVKAALYNHAGTLVTETTTTLVLREASIVVTAVPTGLEITSGSYADITITLKNEGNFRGEALLKVDAFDTLHQERPIALEPGQEITLGAEDETGVMSIEAPSDLPTGTYTCYYTLTGKGIETRTLSGNFSFKVNGIDLEVEAALDRTLYNPGETATLTLDIVNKATETGSTATAPLEAIVNWGEFSETRSFTLGTGSTSLVFSIPLEEARQEKVFYGIYHEGGKGIHLNDIYLNFRGEISVELDKQVYAPGEILHALFTSASGETAGVITATAFDESYTIPLSSTASADFQVPQTALGGTYGVSWDFAPADPAQTGLAGSQAFDVSGLVVKTARSELEQGKYSPGETIKANYIFESNQDQTLELRCWCATPSGDWTYLGQSSVTISSTQQTGATASYSFTTTEAGTHELIYGLYYPGTETDLLVVSGRNSFDVGDAVLLGVNTDKSEYKTGSEPVLLRVDYFGQGTAQLEILLDGESQGQQAIALEGTGNSEVIMDSARLSGGTHTLEATMSQNGLTSTKSTHILYGTDLPDLTLSLTETIRDGMTCTYNLSAVNTGNTTAGSTDVTFSDNSATAGTQSIPSLPPNSATQVVFTWNGTGKIGTHELRFKIDSSNSVKEYSETNNSLDITEDVPELYYDVVLDPLTYPAETAVNIITRLVNNQEIPLQVLLELSIMNEETGGLIHTQTQEVQLSALGSNDLTGTFDTALNIPGTYTLKQQVTAAQIQMSRELYFYIEPTKGITATLQLDPQQIPANTPSDVRVNLSIKNTGNIALEEEPLKIEVYNTETSAPVQSEDIDVTIPYGEEITQEKLVNLNLSEGIYEIRLKQDIEIRAFAELAVVANLKPNTVIPVKPRVLVQLPPAARTLFEKRVLDSQKRFINKTPWSSPSLFLVDILHDHTISFETAFGPLESYIKFHKGQFNIHVIYGNEMGRYVREELQERVFHGENLILICDKPAQNQEWQEFTGMKIKSLPGRYKEKNIQILPSEFSPETSCETSTRIELQLEKKAEDVRIIAQTQQNKIPLMAVRQYGNGHILLITLPLEFSSGSENMEQLLLKAIELFNTDIYSNSPMTRLLPVETTIENNSSQDKQVTVKQIIPIGVEGFDYDPEPEQGEDPQWTLTIPGSSSSVIYSWMKLPDQINTYEIKIQLYDGERLLAEEIMGMEVTATVASTLNELILELRNLGTSKEDARSIRKAMQKLDQVARRPGNTLMDHLLNLHDMIQAAGYLEEVKHIDVTTQRYTCDELMIIMGRRLYETVNTLGQHLFEPLMHLLDEARD